MKVTPTLIACVLAVSTIGIDASAQRQTYTPLDGSDLLYDGMRVIIAANPTTYYTKLGNTYTPNTNFNAKFANVWTDFDELDYSGDADIDGGKFVSYGAEDKPIVFILHKFSNNYAFEIAEEQDFAGEYLNITDGYALPHAATDISDSRRFQISFPAGANGAQIMYVKKTGEQFQNTGQYLWTVARSSSTTKVVRVVLEFSDGTKATTTSSGYDKNYTRPQLCAVDPAMPEIEEITSEYVRVSAPEGYHLWIKPEIAYAYAANEDNDDDDQYYHESNYVEYKLPDLYQGQTMTLHLKSVDPNNKVSSEISSVTIHGQLSGIRNVEISAESQTSKFFNLQGQPVPSENLVPGIYIHRVGPTTSVLVRID